MWRKIDGNIPLLGLRLRTLDVLRDMIYARPRMCDVIQKWPFDQVPNLLTSNAGLFASPHMPISLQDIIFESCFFSFLVMMCLFFL
jgi:hypothetical protein